MPGVDGLMILMEIERICNFFLTHRIELTKASLSSLRMSKTQVIFVDVRETGLILLTGVVAITPDDVHANLII